MQKRNIKKVAVLGSGVMGSRIACHFAGIGLQVLLLDIPAPNPEGEIQNFLFEALILKSNHERI